MISREGLGDMAPSRLWTGKRRQADMKESPGCLAVDGVHPGGGDDLYCAVFSSHVMPLFSSFGAERQKFEAATRG